MKKYVIEYYEIKSDHLLATPEFDRKEIVQVHSEKKLDKYIFLQKDNCGNHYEKASSKKEALFGFTHISAQGALKVYPYKPPKIKRSSCRSYPGIRKNRNCRSNKRRRKHKNKSNNRTGRLKIPYAQS